MKKHIKIFIEFLLAIGRTEKQSENWIRLQIEPKWKKKLIRLKWKKKHSLIKNEMSLTFHSAPPQKSTK